MRHGTSRYTNRLAGRAAEVGQEVASQVAQKTGEALSSAQELGSRVQAAAEEGFEEVRDAAGRYAKKGQAGAQFLYRGLQGALETRPLMMLALAAGCGLLLGALIRRRTQP